MADVPTPLTATPVALTATAATVYTVPGSKIATLMCILAANPTAAAHSVTISIGADALGTRIVPAVQVPGNDHLVIPCFVVLTAAQIIQASSDFAAGINLQLSGVVSDA